MVDVVRIVNINGDQNGEYLIKYISTFESYYNFSVEKPDPRDKFWFTVTPKSNVEGASNGSPNQVNASFSFESKWKHKSQTESDTLVCCHSEMMSMCLFHCRPSALSKSTEVVKSTENVSSYYNNIMIN